MDKNKQCLNKSKEKNEKEKKAIENKYKENAKQESEINIKSQKEKYEKIINEEIKEIEQKLENNCNFSPRDEGLIKSEIIKMRKEIDKLKESMEKKLTEKCTELFDRKVNEIMESVINEVKENSKKKIDECTKKLMDLEKGREEEYKNTKTTEKTDTEKYKELIKIDEFKCKMCSKIINDAIIFYKCSVCYNYYICEKCEEKNYKDHLHEFIKKRQSPKKKNEKNDNKNNNKNNENKNNNIINQNNKEKLKEDENNNNNNNIQMKYKFSIRNGPLINIIFEVEEINEYEFIIKNNGSQWPEGKTKLICDKENCSIKAKDIDLPPLKKNQEKKIKVMFDNINKMSQSEYVTLFNFNVNGENFGEPVIIQTKVDKELLKKFREEYDLKVIPDYKLKYSLREAKGDMNKAIEYLVPK